TVMHSAVAKGQWVVITGQNLQNATQIYFDGVPASFNTALFAPGSAVVQIPNIQFSTIDTAKLYTVKYVTAAGSATFAFKLGPAAPTVSAVSNVFAAPGDSVYLYGTNLVLVQQFSYGGTKIPKFNSNANGTSLGFLMPATTSDKLIIVTTKSGTAVDTIKATPIISSISNENPSMGDSVYIYGTYLKSIQSLTFAGTAITSFTESKDTKSVSFVMPQLSAQSGPVSVITKFGTGTTIYKVNRHTYLQDGVIETMDGPLWTFGGMGGWWGAGSGAVDDAANDQYGWFTHTTDFDGVLGKDKTQFVFLNTGLASNGDGQWYNGWGIDLSNNQWVPVANLADNPGDWALKMEVSVGKDWNGGSLDISPGGGYIYRWEPWSNGKAYKTKGWITVTIPLSSFRQKDNTLGEGMGDPLVKLTDMLDQSGNATAYIYVHNYASAKTTTGFYGGFDNIRVVKIK
ncbi:MAG: glycan-binding surface protein, partial [Mucilaginibacter sp.]